MTSLGGGGGGYGQASNPNAILNECRSIDQGIDEVENNLGQLRMLQDRSLSDADTSGTSATKRQLEGLSAETMDMYRGLVERVRTVKSNPEAQSSKNSAQVGRIDRRLKTVIQQYQQVESQFRKKTQDQMARQYRIVRPEAGEDEVRQAVSDPDGGAVFSQALMQSSRQGQARAALNAVQDRHAEIQRIERQMVELAQMFQDMDTIVVQQEAAVAQIEQKGEEVAENLIKGNEEIEVAVNTARSTRKKKWWCLAICGTFSCCVWSKNFPLTSLSRYCDHRRNCRRRRHRRQRRLQGLRTRCGTRTSPRRAHRRKRQARSRERRRGDEPRLQHNLPRAARQDEPARRRMATWRARRPRRRRGHIRA
jgi:syntaxin 1B/2/3